MWVLTSVDDVTAEEATSHLAQAPQHHEWTMHDLSIIWKTLLGRSLARPLLRGFELFQKVKTRLGHRSSDRCGRGRRSTRRRVSLKHKLVVFLSDSQDCPLVLVLRMFELCCDFRNFTEAKSKLLDFQRTLIAVSPTAPVPDTVRPSSSVRPLVHLDACFSSSSVSDHEN